MTQAEYERLRDLILHTFPELHEHGARYTSAREGETQQAEEHRVATAKAQAERRRDALIGLDAADVRAAIDELRLAATVPWNEYGRQGQGFAMIGERAREIARQRAPLAESERLVKAGTRRRVAGEVQRLVSASGLVEQFIRDRRDGKLPNAKAVREWFDRHDPMTASEEDQKRNRYLCLPCRDSGRHEVVAQIITRDDGTRTWTTSSVACECEAGRQFRERHELARLPVYDETKHVRVVPFVTWEDIVAEMGRVREREFAGKRVDSFDAYNRQGAA